jgi:hypothetical protein
MPLDMTEVWPYLMLSSSTWPGKIMAMSTDNVFPELPHQPKTIEFPKRAYGKCSFQSRWFSLWPFLHYNEAEDKT